jgi:hypothetical protein
MMNKPAFNFISDGIASADWRSCTLVIELNLQYLYYVVLNEGNEIVTIKYFQFPKKDFSEVVKLTEEIFAEDDILRQEMKAGFVVYNSPENCLVPDKYFNPEQGVALIDIIHGDTRKGILFYEEIRGYNLRNVYRVPRELHELVQRYFPAMKHWHHYSLWLMSQPKEKDERNRISIIFYLNEIVVAVFASGSLQVVQSFRYQTADDIAFHLLHICQHFNLEQKETLLQLGGMIDQNSAMYLELLKYFLLIETDTAPQELTMSEQTPSYPAHFFSPLLKLASCVS